MKINHRCASLMLLFFGAVLQCVSQQVSVKTAHLSSCQGRPCVHAALQGVPVTLLLDFQSERSYLTTAAVLRLHLETHSLSARSAVFQETSPVGFTLDDITFDNHKFYVVDSKNEQLTAGIFRNSFEMTEDGAIAIDLFDNRLVKLSIANSMIGISARLHSSVVCKAFCGNLHLDRVGDFGPHILTMTGFLVNEHPAQVRLDSMYVGPPFLTTSSRFQSYVSNLERSSNISHFEGITMSDVGTTGISFGSNMLVRSTQVRYAADGMTERLPFDVTVGTTLLQIADFYFDFKGKHFWIKPSL